MITSEICDIYKHPVRRLCSKSETAFCSLVLLKKTRGILVHWTTKEALVVIIALGRQSKGSEPRVATWIVFGEFHSQPQRGWQTSVYSNAYSNSIMVCVCHKIKKKRSFFDTLTETLGNSPFSDKNSRDLLMNGGQDLYNTSILNMPSSWPRSHPGPSSCLRRNSFPKED